MKLSTLLKQAFTEVTEERKQATLASIEQANSKEYQMQVAEHHFINSVIDDVLSDPYWLEIAQQALIRAERG